MDIGLEEMSSPAMCALVGRLSYRLCCNSTVYKWMNITWEPFLGYLPDLLTLLRGWFGFVFRSPEDAVKILENFWVFEGGNLMLKRWRLKFDPATEYFSY
jgi:hypothetical protein